MVSTTKIHNIVDIFIDDFLMYKSSHLTDITVKGTDLRFDSPSILSASKIWYTNIGMTVNELPIAEFIAARRWDGDTSGVRNNIPQNITLYNTPFSEEQNQYIKHTIQAL